MAKISLDGEWNLNIPDIISGKVVLPGTLDENKVGTADEVAKPWHPDIEDREKASEILKDKRISTRLTRNYTYEGPARFSRIFDGDIPAGKRIFLHAERARAMTAFVDGKKAPMVKGSLSTPYIFEVTGLLEKGSLIELVVDNSYPGLPYKDIVFSSAATDETQTNWNGIIGELYLEVANAIIIKDIVVLPDKEGNIDVKFSLLSDVQEASKKNTYRIAISGKCLAEDVSKDIVIDKSCSDFEIAGISLTKEANASKWDEDEPNLHLIRVAIIDNSAEGKEIAAEEVSFGVRVFSYDETGRLTINGRRFFLRGEANCALFPETGHPPMVKEAWIKIMKTYHSYGVNCVRFHSWCPPEAAFAAADELGMLVQPELSHWNPRDAFSTDESREYYKKELAEILREYGSHPSFVMMTLGNELHTDDAGVEFMHKLLKIAKEMDSTRLYAWGSNNFYGEKGADELSDFYTASAYFDKTLRASGNNGITNSHYADTRSNFSETVRTIREKFERPVFSFEVGQYEVLPDLKEIDAFKGVTRADNLEIVKEKLDAIGVADSEWEKRVDATGEIALLAYREEIEAVLRTPELSGISLLGLQDFTGQGTALVGMLNSHLVPKPYRFAVPERFQEFFRSEFILLEMDKYCYSAGEVIKGEVKVVNYGKKDLSGKVYYELIDAERSIVCSRGEIEGKEFFCRGELTRIGEISILPDGIDKARKFIITLGISNNEVASSYPVWVYPERELKCPENVYETEKLDDKAEQVLKEGGTVFLSPHSTKEALPHSVKAQFTTDFWSVGTFPSQEGAMGQLIDEKHPVFASFPTEYYSNWQWWAMASQRAIILPRYLDAIVTEMDSYATLRPMAKLFDANCENGYILVSSMGLQDLLQYPEARALLASIYDYLGSEKHESTNALTVEEIRALVI